MRLSPALRYAARCTARCASLAIILVSALACSSRDVPAASAAGVNARTVQITGELLANGSCRVRANGAEVFAPGDSARTVVIAGRAANMAPPGHDLYELWCAPADVAEPMVPDSPSDRALVILLYPRAGAAPLPGHYLIARDIPSSGGSATEARAGLSLFDPAHASTHASTAEQRRERAGIAYLAGDSGTVTLSRVDSTRVVGTFTVRATQAWTM